MKETPVRPVLYTSCGRDCPADAMPGILEVVSRDLGVFVSASTAQPAPCDVVQWARWNALSLTGPADGPPAVPSSPWATRVAHVLAVFAELTRSLGVRVDIDPGALLAARAHEAGRTRRGAISLNGSARLIPTVDGWVAVNLARMADREVLPAVTGAPVPAGAEWPALSTWMRNRCAESVVVALQQVGVPASVLGGHTGSPALRVVRYGASRSLIGSRTAPVVVDLSAMWAGPLTAHLLHRAGARVITVEDPARPDGARGGPPKFYAELHRGHECRPVNFGSESGRAELARLVESADVVIEASRPRALRQLGLCAEEFVASRPGRVWVSITGYGRDAFEGMRVAFGDDGAAAGGLIARDGDGAPMFVADAVADPLTGLWAATAVTASLSAGGGHLLDVSMAGVAAEVSAPTTGSRYPHRMRRHEDGRWWVSHAGESAVPC